MQELVPGARGAHASESSEQHPTFGLHGGETDEGEMSWVWAVGRLTGHPGGSLSRRMRSGTGVLVPLSLGQLLLGHLVVSCVMAPGHASAHPQAVW